jgi:ribosomal protein L20
VTVQEKDEGEEKRFDDRRERKRKMRKRWLFHEAIFFY